MNIEKELVDKVLNVKVEGRLDTTTAPTLEEELKEAVQGVEDLKLDFSNLEYISSAGLRVLLVMQKIMNKQGKMSVCGLNETVREIFDVTGFADILTIEEKEEA